MTRCSLAHRTLVGMVFALLISACQPSRPVVTPPTALSSTAAHTPTSTPTPLPSQTQPPGLSAPIAPSLIATAQPAAQVVQAGMAPLAGAPVALAGVVDKRLEFTCIDGSPCFPTVDLSRLPLAWPAELDRVFYADPSSVYATLYTLRGEPPFKRIIIHLNPQTSETKFTEVPASLNFNPYSLEAAITGDRLVMANQYDDTFYIFDRDLSVTPVALGTGIEGMDARDEGLIETNDREVLAFNKLPVVKDGVKYLEVSVIDVTSGQFTYRLFDFPAVDVSDARTTEQPGKKYLLFGRVSGISPDMKQVYLRYSTRSNYAANAPRTLRLAIFDLPGGTEVRSVKDEWPPGTYPDYMQYRDLFYSNHDPCGDCAGSPVVLIDLATLMPRLSTQDIAAIVTQKKRFTVTPFGNLMLLDKGGQIELVDAGGGLVYHYAVPAGWLERAYQAVEYRTIPPN